MFAGWMALHFSIGLAGTWLARRYALRRNLIDQPGARRSHAMATPRGGGIAIVVALLVALGWLAWLDPQVGLPTGLAAAGLVCVAGVGWFDDHRPLSPWWRLGTHVVAAGLLALTVRQLGGDSLQMLIAFGAALVLVNAWNFMDGIDGLAASQAAIVAAGYAIYAGEGSVFWLAWALAAGCCGFLPFNVPKARIFLGDVGSGAIGYAVAGLMALTLLDSAPRTSGWVLVLPLMPFLVDTSLTLASRILRGERWWEPHVQHAYQYWARARGHMRVTLAYAWMASGCVVAMLMARSFPAPLTLCIIAAAVLAGGVVWCRLRGR